MKDMQRMLTRPEIYNKHDDPEALTTTKDDNAVKVDRFSLSKRDAHLKHQSAGMINTGFVSDNEKHEDNENIGDLPAII